MFNVWCKWRRPPKIQSSFMLIHFKCNSIVNIDWSIIWFDFIAQNLDKIVCKNVICCTQQHEWIKLEKSSNAAVCACPCACVCELLVFILLCMRYAVTSVLLRVCATTIIACYYHHQNSQLYGLVFRRMVYERICVTYINERQRRQRRQRRR